MTTYDKEFLISEFWRYYSEYGKYPNSKELNKAEGFPSESGYKRIWKTWSNFLIDIGIIRKDCNDGWYICDENVLHEKYYDGDKQDIIESLMVKRTWGTIKKKASKLGLKRNMELVNYSKVRMSQEFLISELIRYKNEHGSSPTNEQFEKNKEFPSTKPYVRLFGSWNNALRTAGLEINTEFNISKNEVIKRAKTFFEKNGRSPFWNELNLSRTVYEKYWSNFPEMLEEAELPLNKKTRKDHFKSDEELIEDYLNLYNTLGRIPVANDINCQEDMASFPTYKLRFGGYKELWNKCGIDNKAILDTSIYGFICLDKNGDICKSYAEMVITNLFIDNKIEFQKEYSYRNVVPDFSGKSYVMDWYLPKTHTCVEYFGMYKKDHLNKEGKIGDYTRKAENKKKILKESNNVLIDLYQEDLNETLLQRLTEKFSKLGIDVKVENKNLYKNNPEKSIV